MKSMAMRVPPQAHPPYSRTAVSSVPKLLGTQNGSLVIDHHLRIPVLNVGGWLGLPVPKTGLQLARVLRTRGPKRRTE